MTIHILGSEWTLKECSSAEDERLKDCDGYCDWTEKVIVIERETDGNLGNMEEYIKKVKRHEIVHAFLEECGLAECTATQEAWACCEEIVDWFAHLGPQIHKAWGEANAL